MLPLFLPHRSRCVRYCFASTSIATYMPGYLVRHRECCISSAANLDSVSQGLAERHMHTHTHIHTQRTHTHAHTRTKTHFVCVCDFVIYIILKLRANFFAAFFVERSGIACV